MRFWVIICPNRSCWAVNGGPIVIHNEHSASVSPYFVLVTIVATIQSCCMNNKLSSIEATLVETTTD